MSTPFHGWPKDMPTLHPQGESVVQITDPKPLLGDGRCPCCRAAESDRILVATFGGPPRQACGKCGHEFPRED